MTKQKATKRMLLTSILSLALCILMLIGSTFAWFTDTVTSGNNIIKSGNLDIDVEYTLDGDNWNNLDGADDLFQKGLWEPGHTEVVALRIKNNGTLALKYAASMNIIDEIVGKNKDGANIVLSDILTVSTLVQQSGMVGDITVGLAFSGENSVSYENTTTFKAGNVLREDKELAPGDAHYLIIKVDMAETVGNEANHNGTNIPSIDFGIKVLATQYTSESDSFGNQYDKDAEYPKQVIKVSSSDELVAALAGGGEMPIALASDIDDFGGTIATDTVVDLSGYTLRSRGLRVNNDLDMSNGEVSMRTTSGYLDIRPTEDGVYTFTNVDFINEYRRQPNSNVGSDRIETMVKLYPMAVGVKSTFVFENCRFENASLSFGASSDKPADVDIIFKNCTFNAMMGSDAVIEFTSNITGTVNVENCIFNITGTYANVDVISINNWSNVNLTVNATNNTLNANRATPYTYDPAKGETEADSVKIGNVTSVRNYYLFDTLSGGYSTINESDTVLSGDIAIASKYTPKK